ncbi:rhomboid family intramembrane serine protease [Jannaschia sp. W003]|uniref:rhomboid family intramembrane serine protease n=1 Tax=Jannaschia sp. W003 TaxID=2867012 RepID=UPI0021A7F570|nr:rhomboid family intramembrane serine protease [Jannaschia sp. W003]UWQ23207.1 rhomboid family intramembrane serine protease [Jannaschia sp. W003]
MRRLPVSIALAATCVAVEAVLWTGEMGWWGPAAEGLRNAAIWLGALWPALLRGEVAPIYPGQSAVMLLSYPFVHAGPGHMAGNVVVLVWAGLQLERVLGGIQVLVLWVVAASWGAIPMLLSDETAPVVGASGALFGLLGAWIGVLIHDPRRRRAVLRVGLLVVGVGILLPVILPELTGPMAWLVHGGGLVTGLIYGVVAGKGTRDEFLP